MYAITMLPATAYFLTTGHFQHACWWHRTTRLGEIYIGTVNVFHRKHIWRNFDIYSAIYHNDPTLPDPLVWYTDFPRGALVASAHLVAVDTFDEALLSDFERRFMPRNRILYTFENIRPLEKPIFCPQQTGYVWEYNEETQKPKRYTRLSPEQIAQYFDLCLAMERCNNDRDTCRMLEESHPGRFILDMRHFRLRSGIMRRFQGVMRVDRTNWRKIFRKNFPDGHFRAPKHQGGKKKNAQNDSVH